MSRKRRLTRYPWLLGTLIGLGSIIRIPQLFHHLIDEHGWRQTQTAFGARKFADNGVDLLHSPLPVFGPDSDVPMEFPLWQAMASMLMKVGVPTDLAVRMLGLICFQLCAVLLALVLTAWYDRTVALVAVALFEVLPFGLQWGAASLIDFFSVAMALLMVHGLDSWIRRGDVAWLCAGALGAVTGFLVKVTTMPSWTLLLMVSAVVAARERGRLSLKRTAAAGGVVAAGLGAAMWWTSHADSIKESDPLTRDLTSSGLRTWNFGTREQRSDYANWDRILDRVAQTIAGPPGLLVVLIVVGVVLARSLSERLFTVALALVAVSAPLIFFNLYFVHTYYLIAIYPALVALLAIGTGSLLRALASRRGVGSAAVAAVLAPVLIYTGTSDLGRSYVRDFAADPGSPPALSVSTRTHTPGDALVVVIACAWDPEFLYYAHREGLMLKDPRVAQEAWRTHSISDYSYLLSCDPFTKEWGVRFTSEADPASYLPPCVEAVPTDWPGLYRLVRTSEPTCAGTAEPA